MRVKQLLVVTLLFALSRGHAQQVKLQGSVADAQTGKPVAGATIGIAAKNFFFPADDNGKYEIADSRITINDTISISSIGYITQKMVVKGLAQPILIKLMPYVTALKEVKVGLKPAGIVMVGSKKKSAAGSSSFLPGMEEAMFMQGSPGVPGFIESAGFFIEDGGNLFSKASGDVTAPFRIMIYSVAADGAPDKELTEDIIIATGKKNKAWLDVDVSRYHIANPAEGSFVVFALLDKSYYIANNKYIQSYNHNTSSLDTFTPHLGMTQDEFTQTRCYIKTLKGPKARWNNYRNNYSYLMRATIAIEQ